MQKSIEKLFYNKKKRHVKAKYDMQPWTRSWIKNEIPTQNITEKMNKI